MFTSISSVFEAHFCGGSFKSISITNIWSSVSKSCCGEAIMVSCSDESELTNQRCCKNELFKSNNADFSNELVTDQGRYQFKSLSIVNHYLTKPLVLCFLDNLMGVEALYGHPPSSNKPICVKHQVFLI